MRDYFKKSKKPNGIEQTETQSLEFSKTLRDSKALSCGDQPCQAEHAKTSSSVSFFPVDWMSAGRPE